MHLHLENYENQCTAQVHVISHLHRRLVPQFDRH